MSKPKDNSQSKPFYKKAGFWVGAIIALFVLIYIVGPKKSPDEGAQTEDKLAGTNLSKNAVENACQDAKYGVNDGYSVIDISNYGFNTYEFAYDEEGNPLIIAEWNGKKKNTDEQVKFQCYVSGANNENIKVHYIRAGGNDIWKKESDLNYALYDKDGKPQYPELHSSSTEADSGFHGVNIVLSKVNNDTTGKWRVAVISAPITIADHAVEYYNQFIDGKDEIHAIINKSQNTTTKIMRGAMGITVSVYDYVDGEERDAKKMFSGKLLSEKYYDSKTGEEIIID